jgi:hypothetical protein
MVDFIQARFAPGKERDDTFAAQFYDTLQNIHYSNSNILRMITGRGPTFYVCVAGGAEVKALP